MGYWRDKAAPIIACVIREHGRGDMKTLRRALREAYPFGERRAWPYKVWLAEVKRQLGHPLRRPAATNPEQIEMFPARFSRSARASTRGTHDATA